MRDGGLSRVWFAARVVAVKRKYGLTGDPREARTLEDILSGCASTELTVVEGPSPAGEPTPGATAPGTAEALGQSDTNGDGRITCKGARQHGIEPVRREHPACRFMRYEDEAGVVCE